MGTIKQGIRYNRKIQVGFKAASLWLLLLLLLLLLIFLQGKPAWMPV